MYRKHLSPMLSKLRLVKRSAVMSWTTCYRLFIKNQALEILHKTQPVPPTAYFNSLTGHGIDMAVQKPVTRLRKSSVALGISKPATVNQVKRSRSTVRTTGTNLEQFAHDELERYVMTDIDSAGIAITKKVKN